MGKIIATNGQWTQEFTCEKYALMGYTVPAGWTVTENTCGIYVGQLRSPYASFGLDLAGTALPGNWYSYKATISSNRVIIPGSEIILPSNPHNVFVVVRRQQYHPSVPNDSRDFTVNNADNSIDFNASLGLNGQVAHIRVFK